MTTGPSRKDLVRACKEAPVQAGLWLIRNLRNGKVLLGAAANVPSRLNRHRFALQTRSHECRELQADWDALGPDAFLFECAELLKRPEDNPFFDVAGALKDMEAAWIQRWEGQGGTGYPAKNRTKLT